MPFSFRLHVHRLLASTQYLTRMSRERDAAPGRGKQARKQGDRWAAHEAREVHQQGWTVANRMSDVKMLLCYLSAAVTMGSGVAAMRRVLFGGANFRQANWWSRGMECPGGEGIGEGIFLIDIDIWMGYDCGVL